MVSSHVTMDCRLFTQKNKNGKHYLLFHTQKKNKKKQQTNIHHHALVFVSSHILLFDRMTVLPVLRVVMHFEIRAKILNH